MQNTGPGSKVVNTPKHGKQVRVSLRVDPPNPRLMVLLQQVGSQMPTSNIGVFQREARIDHRTADHLVRRGKIMVVVAVRASESDHGCYGRSSPSGPAGPLLIICASGRHVA